MKSIRSVTRLIFACAALMMAACQPRAVLTPTYSPRPSVTPASPPTQPTSTARPATATASKTPTRTISPSPILPKTIEPSAPMVFGDSPVILTGTGKEYETLFSIPTGDGSVIRYNIPACCGNIEGPNAIAVLPDTTILISDTTGKRLVYYSMQGKLLRILPLARIGIAYVRDMRVRGEKIYLLETGYHNIRIHVLTLDGDLITSEEVPYQYTFSNQHKENTLEIALTGLSIDCVNHIVLEVEGGGGLYPLSEVQKQTDPDLIQKGLVCAGKRFYVSTPGLWHDPQVTAGEMVYRTHLSQGLGGFQFLEIFQDGSFYLVCDDVMPVSVIQVDRTIHYIDSGGTVRGTARIPLSEYFFPIERSSAVSPDGEVIAMLPHKDSLDVIRLNFYSVLEHLIPEASAPVVTKISR